MTIQDLIITPIYLIVFSVIAYYIKPFVTNHSNSRYFFPALFAKFAGAILLGMLYQFYYGGGDTFNYFHHGSRYIWEAFTDDFYLGLQFLAERGGARNSDTFEYSQHIWYYKDVHSYFVVRITALFDLFTLHTYSATALFFAVFSFSGSWALFRAVERKYRSTVPVKWLAISILFIPSVVFWGSGILKDTITLGALGWLVYALFMIIDQRKYHWFYFLVVIMVVSSWVIYSIKIYILLSTIPAVVAWLYWKNISRIRNSAFKVMIIPFMTILFGIMGFGLLQNLSSVTDRYSLESIPQRVAITAYDIRYGWGARTGGDGGYDIGIPDGTWQGMLKLLPAAINVSLFRPYIWEVRNPLMLLAFIESFIVFGLTFWILFWNKGYKKLFKDPFLIFCITFSLLFAFSIGVSAFNFGTLMRYKIPMMPFYTLVLVVCYYKYFYKKKIAK